MTGARRAAGGGVWPLEEAGETWTHHLSLISHIHAHFCDVQSKLRGGFQRTAAISGEPPHPATSLCVFITLSRGGGAGDSKQHRFSDRMSQNPCVNIVYPRPRVCQSVRLFLVPLSDPEEYPLF